MKWIPIESAPKGGGANSTTNPNNTAGSDWTVPPNILLHFKDGQVSVGYWDWFYADGGQYFNGELPWVESFNNEQLSERYGAPTHWMPLPRLWLPHEESAASEQLVTSQAIVLETLQDMTITAAEQTAQQAAQFKAHMDRERSRVWVSFVEARLSCESCTREGAVLTADACLKAFDERFPI